MVVLAAAVLTKAGKTLISRHYVEVSRMRIEGLLAAFPKLLGGGNQQQQQQHTFVETESVRYVYQPLDTLFMLIITNKSSNIIEDLETLHLLAKLIPEYCNTIDEAGVLQAQFELIFAFDEAVALGYRENVKIDQIRTYTEMESHEENLARMIQKQAEEEAKRRGDQVAAQLAAQRRQGGGNTTFSSNSGSISSQNYSSNNVSSSSVQSSIPQYQSTTTPTPSRSRVSGMSLGGKSSQAKASAFVNALQSEGELTEEIKFTPAATKSISSSNSSATNAATKGVHVVIEEKINVKLDREGGLQSVELLGNLTLLVQDQKLGLISLQCTPLDGEKFQLKINPKINKDTFGKTAVLELADKSRGFAEGSSLPLIKWRLPPSTDESRVPLMVNCWPSENGAGYSVNLDFELLIKNLSLENVVIGIPLGSFGAAPQVIQVDGDAAFNNDSKTLLWHIQNISSKNSTGTLEFEICGGPGVDSFFPINISFSSLSSYSGFKLLSVVDATDSSSVDYSHVTSLASDQYLIV